MTLPVVAALMLVLGASPSARSQDLQVEAMAAAGAELPELREAVARALVVGGARVVMRGPTAGACEYCTRVKVIETGPGIFRIEIEDQDNLASTTLDLSSGSRLLDRARAIAIHTRLLMGRPSAAPSQAETQARPPRTAKGRVASWSSGSIVPPESEPRTRPSAPSPPVDQSAQPERAPVRTGHDESKPPGRTAEVKRPVPAEAKVAEAAPAPSGQAKTEGAPTRDAIEMLTAPAASSPTPRPQWPWIPMAVGAGAGLAAGICALVARDRYNGLSDKTQSLNSARSLKSSGESWQWASYLLAAAAAAGVGVGIAGFALSSSGGHTATVAPIPGGGMAMMTWGVP